MNPTASSFTPLESLLLFQSILKYGIDGQAFSHISTLLRNNAFIRDDASYDADRLSSESLQQLFLHLLRDELKAEEHAPRTNGGGAPHLVPPTAAADPGTVAAHANTLAPSNPLSPSSKKRKLSSPPLLTLNDVRAHVEKLPRLVERLYARYRDHMVSAIREDERRFAQLQDEIRVLEQEEAEEERKSREASARQAEQQRQTPAAAGQKGHPPAVDKVQKTAASSQPAPPTKILPPVPSTPLAPLIPTNTKQQAPLHASNKSTSGTTVPAPVSAPVPVPVSVPPQHKPPPPATQPDSAAPSRIPQTAAAAAAAPAAHPPKPIPPPLAATSAPAVPTVTATPAVQAHLAPVAARQPVPGKTPQPFPQHPPLQIQLSQPAQTRGPTLQTSTSVPTPVSAPTSTLQRPLQPAPHAALATASSAANTQRPTPSVAPVVKPDQRPLQPQAILPAHGQLQNVPATGGQQMSTSTSRASVSASSQDSAPHNKHPRLPEHVRTPAGSLSPTSTQSPRPFAPQTPVPLSAGNGFLPRGSGTRWKPSEPTPSTPGPDMAGIASPAYEPLSPVMDAAGRARFVGREATLRGQRGPKKQQQAGVAPRPRGRPPRSSRSQAEPPVQSTAIGHPRIKNEVSTPRALDDVSLRDATTASTAEEGGLGDEALENSPNGPSSRPRKRKREESVDFPSPRGKSESVEARRRQLGPAVPPTHVLWMRGFPKISASALDQISSHRNANMFAHKIRDRDAPGYDSIVRHPVDLKMVRMAIMAGNKAAGAAAAALPESEQTSSSSVWLPISEDLVPPRGIINSSQLESELVHMFANAIMYNPDSHRGPGPAFIESEGGDDDSSLMDASGGSNSARYKVDEDGVVNDTRGMYIEVEKLLSEMRSAERQRGVPPPPPNARGLGIPIQDPKAGTEQDGDRAEEDEGGPESEPVTESGGGRHEKDKKDRKDKKDKKDKKSSGPAAEEDGAAEGAGTGTIKRRRVTRGQ